MIFLLERLHQKINGSYDRNLATDVGIGCLSFISIYQNLNFGISFDLFLQRALIPALQPKKKKDHIDHDWGSCSIKGQKRGLHMQEMGGM